MGTEITEYKPLCYALTFDMERFYTNASVEDVAKQLDTKERVLFSVWGALVKSSDVRRVMKADPEEAMIAWELSKLSEYKQKRVKKAIAEYESKNPFKVLSPNMVKTIVDRIENGEEPFRQQPEADDHPRPRPKRDSGKPVSIAEIISKKSK